MRTTREETFYKIYSKLASSEDDPEIRSGRVASSSFQSPNKFIFNDVIRKLEVKKNLSVLSIGIGCGEVSKYWLQRVKKLNLKLTCIDFPLVLDKMKEDNKKIISNNVDFIDGIFPTQTSNKLIGRSFDRIEAYSVIQCSDNPFEFIKSAVALLKPNGKLLIGDIPNLNKKGRFITSNFGKEFDQKYTQKTDDQVFQYNHHEDFVKNALKEGSPDLTDRFILKVFKHFRKKGFNVFLSNQHSKLPFHFTREDLIIEAPFE